MSPRELREFARHRYDIYLSKGHDGWHYAGPAATGPRHVRRSGRGPYWRGPVSPQFVGALLSQIRRVAGGLT